MKYYAGKSKFAKKIAKAILRHTPRRSEYFEPFVGGGSILEEMSPHFCYSYASDTHRDLILMWQALQEGWTPPDFISREDYYKLKTSPASALRGFAGFACSFGGLWFGAYARFIKPNGTLQNFADESKRNLQHCMDRLRNTTFERMSYVDIPYTSRSVIYCDPPYDKTYSYTSFRPDKFWDWTRSAVIAGAHVYISEFNAPPDFVPIWQLERFRFMRSKKGATAVETLYVHESQKEPHSNTWKG